MVEMKIVEPTRLHILSKALSFAEMAEKTSGAPLPRAKSVTPARDSEIFILTVRNSREGDRYSSAVEERLYMNISIKRAPIGIIAMIFPVLPKVASIPQ